MEHHIFKQHSSNVVTKITARTPSFSNSLYMYNINITEVFHILEFYPHSGRSVNCSWMHLFYLHMCIIMLLTLMFHKQNKPKRYKDKWTKSYLPKVIMIIITLDIYIVLFEGLHMSHMEFVIWVREFILLHSVFSDWGSNGISHMPKVRILDILKLVFLILNSVHFLSPWFQN